MRSCFQLPAPWFPAGPAPAGFLRLRGEFPVGAAKEDEGLAGEGGVVAYFGQEQQVVAAVVAYRVAAFEVGAGPDEQGRAERSGKPFHAGEAVLRRAGEAVRQRALPGGEERNAEVGRFLEPRQQAQAPRQAEDDERRLERDRVERIDGQTQRCPFGRARGQHGDARGELAQGAAQLPRIQTGGRRNGRGRIHLGEPLVRHVPGA